MAAKIHPEFDSDRTNKYNKKSKWISFNIFKKKNKNKDYDDESPGDVDEVKKDNNGYFFRKNVPDFIPPPLPNLGKPIDVNVLIDRNKRAEETIKATINLITKDIKGAINDVENTPVGVEVDRVVVTGEILDRINQHRTKKDIRNKIKRNLNEIQRTLIFRNTVLGVMNANYSKTLVSNISPIDVADARGVIKPL
eukprot:gene17148-22662_t